MLFPKSLKQLNAWAIVLVLGWSLAAPGAIAGQIALPLSLDYGLLGNVLRDQVLGASRDSAEVYADQSGCNRLAISNPRVQGAEAGRVRILVDARANIGTPVSQSCALPINWDGTLELIEEAYIEADKATIAFRVVDSNWLKADEQGRAVPGVLWNWVKSRVHPRMETLKIDLAPGLAEIDKLLRQTFAALPENGASEEKLLSLSDVRADDDKLSLTLSVVIPEGAPVTPQTAQPVLTEQELAQWDATWKSWDGFATWLIKTLAIAAEPELAEALAETLLEARYDLRDALASETHDRDMVRDLFIKTWDRLAPLLRQTELEFPGIQALQLVTFISAADALRALDEAAPQLGFRIDSDNLRRLARLIVPGVTADQLDYGTEVDPALRKILGLEPEFGMEDSDSPRPFAWLISAAHAGQIDPALLTKLTGWVASRKDLDGYLQTVGILLDQVANMELAKGKVPAAFHDIYRPLLRATAWQETCWRQYVRNAGKVQTIRSKTGAIGLMQVNQHVWRGVYNLDSLNNDIGYNARAGNEILAHYLVDFAIRKKEHVVSGDAQNLARAAYAAYNGGPGQLSRYRNPNTGKANKAIDTAFWKKYQAIRTQGYAAVKQCYGV